MTSSPPPLPSAAAVAQAGERGSEPASVLESLTVDTTSREFMEIDRNTTPAVVAARFA